MSDRSTNLNADVVIDDLAIEASASATGASTIRDTDVDNVASVCKASAGNLYKVIAWNLNAVDAYIQFYDVAAGSVIVGTTIPKISIPVPAGTDSTHGAGVVIDCDVPVSFATAITYAATTTATGGTDPTTGLIADIFYK